MQSLTTSVNDQLVCGATNFYGSDVGHIFIGHGARTDKLVAVGLLVVVMIESVAAVGNEVLDRSDVLNLCHGKSGNFTARLDGRGRYAGCCCGHEGDGSVEVHIDD